eukprot:5818294-Prymnesium_polylepis.2
MFDGETLPRWGERARIAYIGACRPWGACLDALGPLWGGGRVPHNGPAGAARVDVCVPAFQEVPCPFAQCGWAWGGGGVEPGGAAAGARPPPPAQTRCTWTKNTIRHVVGARSGRSTFV